HVMDSWHSLQLIEGEDADDFNGYRACCWSVLQPYFTDMGWKEYGQLAAKPGKFIPGELR
ncbi:MAG: hypothetical protein KDD10_05785, partial [Phaeodactylibacter sp.]|nr:hypothetical protein [Phaeodactylibacter sp.]